MLTFQCSASQRPFSMVAVVLVDQSSSSRRSFRGASPHEFVRTRLIQEQSEAVRVATHTAQLSNPYFPQTFFFLNWSLVAAISELFLGLPRVSTCHNDGLLQETWAVPYLSTHTFGLIPTTLRVCSRVAQASNTCSFRVLRAYQTVFYKRAP